MNNLLTGVNENTGADQLIKVGDNGEILTKAAAAGSGEAVQGNVASGATDAGNPVKVGGKYNSAPPTYANGQRTDLQVGTRGSLNVTLFSPDSLSPININDYNADAITPGRSLQVTSEPLLYNNSTADRQRNNHEVTAFTSAARTAATTIDITNYNARFATFTIDITAVSGSPSLTFSIKYKDSLSGKYVTILASASLTGTGTTTLTIGPGLPATANVSANTVLPRVIQVAVAVGTADSVTYSVSVNFVN